MKNESYIGVYIAAWEHGKFFHLADYTLESGAVQAVDGSITFADPGAAFKKVGGQMVWIEELTEAEKKFFSADAELKKLVEQTIIDNCTGKSNYAAGVWACGFNPFLAGFSTFHFEV